MLERNGFELTVAPRIGQCRVRENFDAIAAENFLDLHRGIGIELAQEVLAALEEHDADAKAREELTELTDLGAVGDMSLRFFDAKGAPVITPLNERVIGMTLDEIKASRRVVAVAGGPRKVAAIRGAMLGGYIDVLITDHFTAERLLAEAAPGNSKGKT